MAPVRWRQCQRPVWLSTVLLVTEVVPCPSIFSGRGLAFPSPPSRLVQGWGGLEVGQWGGDGDACGHLECGLRRKPGVSKVQVEPLRRGWGCRPSAAVPMTSSLCPGDLWAGAQPRRHPAVLWSPAPLRLLAEVWRTCRPRPDQPAHPRRRHRLSSQEVMEAATGPRSMSPALSTCAAALTIAPSAPPRPAPRGTQMPALPAPPKMSRSLSPRRSVLFSPSRGLQRLYCRAQRRSPCPWVCLTPG